MAGKGSAQVSKADAVSMNRLCQEKFPKRVWIWGRGLRRLWSEDNPISGIPRADYIRADIAEEMLAALKLVKKYEAEYRTWGVPGFVNVVDEAICEAEKTE